MHWGIRRYQPYPGQGGMTKRRAKKAVKIINSNAKRNAIKEYYKDESVKAYQIHMQKAKEAMRDDKDKKVSKQLKKAGKEMADIMTLDKQIKSGKAEINKALKNLNENGYKTLENTKIKRFADLGRTITDPFTPSGAIGVAQTSGPNGTQTGIGPAIVQRAYSKTKLQKKTSNTTPFEEAKNKGYPVTVKPKRDSKPITLKETYKQSYKKTKDPIERASYEAEKIHNGYGSGSVNMSHPAVKWAINEAVKKGGNKQSVIKFIKDEGEPPRHDDWTQVVLDYEKSKKKK